MSETVSLEPVDEVAITIVMDNVTNVLMPDEGPAKRVGVAGAPPPFRPSAVAEEGRIPDSPRAEHGFSALVDVRRGETEHRLLFDAGVSPDGVTENLSRFDVDTKEIEAIICSHGHFDHVTGLDGLISTLGRTNLPVVFHPAFWTKRRVAIPGRDPFDLPTPSRSALEGAGFELVESKEPSMRFADTVLVTGEVDRSTDFETGFDIHEALGDDGWEPDPMIWDDQALVVNVRGKGLVVLTGCGHAGVVNTLRYARALTGVDDVFAVVGGFHLSGPLFEPVIPPTIDALVELRPEWIVPGHCTGWRATHELARRFPDAFIQTAVGTRFEFAAA